MKKFFALLLALTMVFALAACGNDPEPTTAPTTEATAAPTTAPTTEATEAPTTEPTTEATLAPGAVMTHEEYMAAEMDTNVVVEFYVQGHQSWWDNKITVYGQDENGGYFVYELACSEEDAAKLVPGTKIRVTGFKGEWEGEVEIMDGTFTFVDAEPWIAEALDVTALLGTDDLIKHQNEKVLFKGVTVEEISYKNGEPGDDIYVTIGYNGATYGFVVELYLTGPDTDVYTTVGTLEVGDVIDIEGFLYWYQGVNTHITAVTPVAE